MLPKKDQTSVKTVSEKPAKSDGKNRSISPSPVGDINTADDDLDMCGVRSYCNQTGSQPAGSAAAVGSLTTGRLFQIHIQMENLGVEAVRAESSSICLVG